MTISATITQQASLGPYPINSGAYGIVSQADESYLAGLTWMEEDFPYPTHSEWYRSTDNGKTWTARGTDNGLFGQTSALPTNVHENILLASADIPETLTIQIYRSIDGANTFDTVYEAATAASPDGRSVAIYGLQSYLRDHAIAWGELDGNENNPAKIYGISEDAGATWTPVSTFDAGDKDDVATGFGLADDGTWYLAYVKFGGINRQSWLARSDNYGGSWTVKLRTRNSDAASWVNLYTFACFDKENFVLGGTNGVTPFASKPAVWWSNNGGTTLTHVPAADIASFPNGGFYTNTQELKRLTKDACILAFDQQNGTPGCPYRISYDQGHTFPIIPQRASGNWPTYTVPYGKIVVARDGAILSMAWESADYEEANLVLYRTELLC